MKAPLNTAYPTEPGWYCLGFDREDGAIQADIGPHMDSIFQFDGRGWFDESGDVIDSVYNPSLGFFVAMDAADYYIRQG